MILIVKHSGRTYEFKVSGGKICTIYQLQPSRPANEVELSSLPFLVQTAVENFINTEPTYILEV